MELSVKVQGLTGGVDVHIRIELRARPQTEEARVSDEPNWFSANDLGAWVAEHLTANKNQGIMLFGVLYRAAYDHKIGLAWMCSRPDGCVGRSCRGVHRLAGFAYALLDEDALSSVPGVGGKRLEAALAYRDYWSQRVPASYRLG